MKIIRNNYIPFSGYKAMNLFGVLFVRGNAIINERTIRHESIHTAQMKEMLYVFFYVWYVRLPFGNAYRNISFEREAYTNQDDLSYLKSRKRFDFVRSILSQTSSNVYFVDANKEELEELRRLLTSRNIKYDIK